MFWRFNEESNSIAVLVNHLRGNMRSRWVHFYTEDGEKPWRNRDTKFEDVVCSKEELLLKWKEGWGYVFDVVDRLRLEDLEKTVYIRGEAHSVIDAINRQLAHYAYHVGQIVYVAKMLKGDKWNSLSIPKGQSQAFNDRMNFKA